ncbi:MAG TPA: hypothetical protein VHA54_12025 [Solirubrobacterales bacterium]|nr:hypothetical protein [Solirubrobacterales bacterium]
MLRRFALLAVLVAVALAALAPAFASGAGRNSTKIVVSLKFPAFHGKLASPRKGCLGSRTVKMYRVHAGKKRLLGKDRSEDNGKWMVKAGKLTSGEYFATVARRGKCKAAKSQVLTID